MIEFTNEEIENMADSLWEFHKKINLGDVQALIRQQAERIEELEKRPAINKEDGLVCAKCYGSFKQNPLTKEEIDDLVHEHNLLDDYPYDFVRAIEERHGIK